VKRELTSAEKREISRNETRHGTTAVIDAIEMSREYNPTSWQYIEEILKRKESRAETRKRSQSARRRRRAVEETHELIGVIKYK